MMNLQFTILRLYSGRVYNLQRRRGFTLVELLVVISVIGILATLVTANYLSSQRSARDARRRSDINAFRSALELYANDFAGMYPLSLGDQPVDQRPCGGADPLVPTYMGICPNDPRLNIDPAQDNYMYNSNSTDYCIWADLEDGDFFEVCSNGSSGEVTSPPTGV